MARREKATKSNRVTVRFEDEEFRLLLENADVSGLSLAAYIRARCRGRRIAAKADLKNLSELRRLGGLLKHIHNETKGMYSEHTAKAVSDISTYVRKMSRELDKRRVSAK
jgi:hypothetical protein